jgi:hypothetical protein
VLRGRIWAGAIVLAFGVLIHENILLLGFPAVVVTALVRHVRGDESLRGAQALGGFARRYGALILLPLLVFAGIVIQGTFVDSMSLRSQLVAHLQQFVFVGETRDVAVPLALTSSFGDFYRIQSQGFLRRIMDVTQVAHIVPPLVVLLLYGWRGLGSVPFKRSIFALLVAAALLPLSLHMIAWDKSRIWTYPLVAAMLGVWGIVEVSPPGDNRKAASISLRLAAIAVVATQLFIHTPLMDAARERFSAQTRLFLYAPPLAILAVTTFRSRLSRGGDPGES